MAKKEEESLLMKQIKKGKSDYPPRIIIYGVEGIGKSTLASQFPSPIFLDLEGGVRNLNVHSLPIKTAMCPSTLPNIDDWTVEEEDLYGAIHLLHTETHNYKTLVLDTADRAVKLIEKHIRANVGANELGFNKDKVKFATELQLILMKLTELNETNNMNIVVLAHASPVRTENPSTGPYDSWALRLAKGYPETMSVLVEWCDLLGFAAYDIFLRKSDEYKGKKKNLPVSNNQRWLYTHPQAQHMAKNRYHITEDILLDYDELATIVNIHN